MENNGVQRTPKWKTQKNQTDPNGTRMGSEWDLNGTQMGPKWDPNGTQMDPNEILKWTQIVFIEIRLVLLHFLDGRVEHQGEG
jgi:hypothetical protein